MDKKPYTLMGCDFANYTDHITHMSQNLSFSIKQKKKNLSLSRYISMARTTGLKLMFLAHGIWLLTLLMLITWSFKYVVN